MYDDVGPRIGLFPGAEAALGFARDVFGDDVNCRIGWSTGFGQEVTVSANFGGVTVLCLRFSLGGVVKFLDLGGKGTNLFDVEDQAWVDAMVSSLCPVGGRGDWGKCRVVVGRYEGRVCLCPREREARGLCSGHLFAVKSGRHSFALDG